MMAGIRTRVLEVMEAEAGNHGSSVRIPSSNAPDDVGIIFPHFFSFALTFSFYNRTFESKNPVADFKIARVHVSCGSVQKLISPAAEDIKYKFLLGVLTQDIFLIMNSAAFNLILKICFSNPNCR